DVLAKDFYEDPITSTELRDINIFRWWIQRYSALFEASSNSSKSTLRLRDSVMIRESTFSINSNSGKGEISDMPMNKKPTVGHRKIPKVYLKLQYISKVLSSIDIFLFPVGVLAHRRGLKCMQVSSLNSSFWITGGYDGIIRIFDINTLSCHAQYVGHRSIVTDLKVTKKDLHIISVSFDRTIKIWNVQTAVCERTFTGHSDGITSCDISPDQRYLATSSMDNTARIYDLVNGVCVAIVKKHTKWIKSIRFSPDGTHVATASLDHKVYIWDMRQVLHSKNMTYTRCIDVHHDSVLCVVMQKPNLLLTASRDMTIRLFDYVNGSEIHCITMAPSWACTVCFSGDGQLFAAGSYDNTISIFRTKSGERIRQLRIFNSGILTVSFSENEQYIVCGTSDGLLQHIPL
ncbi:WD40 repeat-like protein, partial [Rozella allomycis CSF55]